MWAEAENVPKTNASEWGPVRDESFHSGGLNLVYDQEDVEERQVEHRSLE